MPAFKEKFNEYSEEISKTTQSKIDSAVNYAKEDDIDAEKTAEKGKEIASFASKVNELQSKMLSGIKVDFKTPDSINHFYRIENGKIVFQIDQVKNYLEDVYKRLSGMKKQRFGEISKENNFTGTILAIQIALKSFETDPRNPRKYNVGQINGEYNESTKSAIYQFQANCKLQWKDGKPGKETIGRIVKELDNLLNNKKLERNEQEILKTDVSNIIEESVNNSGFLWLKDNMIDYIIKGEFNSGKNLIIESQIKILANNSLNWKLKYLVQNSDKPLKNNIQYIQKEENLRKSQFQADLNKLNQRGEGNKKNGTFETNRGGSDKYTFGHNLTESQKGTITNVLSRWNSPVTAKMVSDSCQNAKNVPVEYLLGFMQNDSRVGTMGRGARTHNPGNVGNTNTGTKDWGTREKGVEACANNLQKRIDAYLDAKDQHNGKGFNDFPTPEELATGKAKGGFKFFGIYMTASDGPRKVAGMVKTWVNRLKGK